MERGKYTESFQHFFRAYVATGGESMVTANLAAVALELKKLKLAKTLVTQVLESNLAIPKARAIALKVTKHLVESE